MGSAIVPHWAPESYISPCFHHYQPDDALVRTLTRTQVALHEGNLKYQELLRQAQADKEAWQRHQSLLNEQLSALLVRNAEAERLFRRQEQQLDTRLKGTQEALDDLHGQHQQLRDASAEQLRQLQQQLAAVQAACADLQAERAHLQAQLKDAHSTAAALQQATQRVGQLEAGIQALQARAQQMLDDVQRQRDAAQAGKRHVESRLTDTQRALMDQTTQREAAQHELKVLQVQTHQLSHALQLERLINEPLRHTNHASTTIAHVMRSAAAPVVEDRAHVPLGRDRTATTTTTYLWGDVPPSVVQHGVVPAGPAQTLQPRPPIPQEEAGPPGAASPPATPSADAEQQRFTAPPQAAAASSAQVPGVEGALVGSTYLKPAEHSQAGAPSPPGTFLTQLPAEPSLGQWQYETVRTHQWPSPAPRSTSPAGQTVRELGGGALTRLGRAWATTTPTAGAPHPAFLDNLARFAPVYNTDRVSSVSLGLARSPAGKAQAVGQPRPQSAGPAVRRTQPLQAPLSPTALESRLQATGMVPSSARSATGRAPSAAASPGQKGKSQRTKGSSTVHTEDGRAPRKPSSDVVRTYHQMRRATGSARKNAVDGSPASVRTIPSKAARAMAASSSSSSSSDDTLSYQGLP